MSKTLITMALPMEAGKMFGDVDILFTGVGKVNAAHKLVKAISSTQIDTVINLGTAGSHVFNTGELVCCREFIQRDMDVRPLGFSAWQTPFEEVIQINNGLLVDGLKVGRCGTGDSFATDVNTDAYDVVDMEAYALAKICHAEDIPFTCVKYISDGANHQAHLDWQEALEDGAKKLRNVLNIIQERT